MDLTKLGGLLHVLPLAVNLGFFARQLDHSSRTAFGPSCTKFVNPGCWHFDSGIIDDVLLKHVGLLHVLPLAVHLILLCKAILDHS